MNDLFWSFVNRYISRANELKEETSMPQASSSLLYASARYNALNIMENHSENEREAKIKEHVEMYEEFLRNSFEYLENEKRT